MSDHTNDENYSWPTANEEPEALPGVEIDLKQFDNRTGSYFITNEMAENADMWLMQRFAGILQRMQHDAQVDISITDTSTGILVSWKPTRAR
jgi:hypothetical protein